MTVDDSPIDRLSPVHVKAASLVMRTYGTEYAHVIVAISVG